MKSFLIFLSLIASEAMATRTILITAFDGFAGEKINWSYDVAKKLKDSEKKIGKDVHVEVCQLQTIYDLSAEQAKKCFENLKEKPVAVISMGEGGCRVDLETVAHNRDHEFNLKDNGGKRRVYSAIAPSAPLHAQLGFPIDKVYCEANLTDDERKFSFPSTSPGAFVCNNLAFHLAEFFKNKNIPYQFIHVPSHKCVHSKKTPLVESEAVSKSVSIVLKILKSELIELKRNPNYSSPMPVALAPIRGELERIKSSKNKFDECRRKFLNGLYEELIIGEKL